MNTSAAGIRCAACGQWYEGNYHRCGRLDVPVVRQGTCAMGCHLPWPGADPTDVLAVDHDLRADLDVGRVHGRSDTEFVRPI